MKKILVFVSVIGLSVLNLAGQITNIKTSDSSVVINKVYAGMLSNAEISTDSLYAGSQISFRLGGMATWQITDWLQMQSFAAHDFGSGDRFTTAIFKLSLKPTKRLTLDAGRIPALSTLFQRPNPVTAAGHFETWTQQQIPGPGLGASARYATNWSEGSEIGSGVVLRGSVPEYHGTLVFRKVIITGYYRQKGDVGGFAFTYNNKNNVFSTLAVRQDLIGNVFVLNVGKNKSISLYSDAGVNFNFDELLRGETGVLKNFKSVYLSGLVGLGYDYKRHVFKGYCFLHL